MPEQKSLSRLEFLQLAALGAGGAGLAAMVGCQSTNGPTVRPRGGYVVAVTHGPMEADRVMLALVTASRLPKGDNHVWFSIDGGQIAKIDEAAKLSSPLFDTQGTAQSVLEVIRSQGTSLHV